MRGVALLVPFLVLLLAGCFGPPPDCRPNAKAGWASLVVYDGLGAAGVKASSSGSGLPYHADELDAKWRDYELRNVAWSVPVGPDEVRDRESNVGGVSQVEPGSPRVWFSMSVGSSDDAAATRAFYDGLATNLTTAGPAELDGLYDRLLESKYESAIVYPDDPALRHVDAYGYSAKATLPLRLSELDAELRALHAPQHSPMGIGQDRLTMGHWTFSFDLPVRSADLEVDGVDVTIKADAGGNGLAVARPVADAGEGQTAILAAFADLGVAPPLFDGPYYDGDPACGD